jgi:hypothetical protein
MITKAINDMVKETPELTLLRGYVWAGARGRGRGVAQVGAMHAA